LKADVGCRNTLFNGTPQSAVEYLPRLISHGARHLRIEFLDDEPADVVRTIGVYRDVLDGKRDAKNLWRELRSASKYGVTRGPLNVL
jgi:U32 family peptidase